MSAGNEILLYNYFRSSASYRVRIALHFKNVPFKYMPIHLVKNGGEQYSAEYKKLNPQSTVPCLVRNGLPLSQSMAIIQYLEDVCPDPRLFPTDPYEKALVIQICEAINSGLQPLQNLSVLNKIESQFKAANEDKNLWVQHWSQLVLTSVEEILKKTAGQYAFGDELTAADCFIVPQIFSAKRFNVDFNSYETIKRVYAQALEHPAVQMAAPEKQPDYVP